MNRLFTILLLGTLLSITSFSAIAQQATIKGRVKFSDDPGEAVGVVVTLNAWDTAKLQRKGRVIATDAKGGFSFTTNEKKIDLTFDYLGYERLKLDVPLTGERTIDLGIVTLNTSAFDVEVVQVVGQASMGKVEGDTVQYNAAAFKTNPDATAEDLLKKMPGVTTDENGNVQSQGQSIGKVYVNGKEYFQDDPTLALKSLPVDAVESMQLYDDQSDDAKFSGFDDGQRVRAINIVTKKGVMNSTFGKAYVGYGLGNKYSAGIGVNTFSDKHRFVLTAQANNINNQGFTLNDISQSGGGRGGRGQWRSGGNDLNGFTTPTRGGIMETYMIGGNYNGEFKNLKVNASYFYNGNNADVWRVTDQNYLTTPRQYSSIDSSLGYGNNHRFNARIEWNPTENDRINFNPSLSYSNNLGSSSSLSETMLNDLLSNASDSRYNTKLDRLNGSADLWWMHRFAKPGRTLSLGGIVNGRRDFGNRSQLSNYGSTYDNNGTSMMTYDQINLIAGVASSGYTFTGSATYAEPVSKRSRLMANYSITYDKTLTNKEGFNWDELEQRYALEDTSTTNYINRNYLTNLAGIGYNYVLDKTLNLTVNVNYQNSTLDNNQNTLRDNRIPFNESYNFDAVLPSLSLSFTPARGQNLKLDYNANSIFPSVTQLQTILDNTNPLQVSIGNRFLEQSYSHQMSLRYNFANPEKNINFNLFANGTITSNYIATERILLTEDTPIEQLTDGAYTGMTLVKGSQFSRPVNLQGYVNAGLFSNFGFGIKPLKSNVNVSLFYRYGRTPSKLDGIEYLSNSNRIGGGLSVTSNISESVDFTVAYRPGLNITQGGTGQIDRYFSHDLSAFVNIIFARTFFINADLSWRNSFGTQDAYDNHYAMLNGAIGFKFLKQRQAEFRLSVYDALGQNRSIWQTSADTYTQITQSQVLTQYFMLAFTWKFDTRKSGKRIYEQNDSGRPRGMMGPH